ncbi:MAG: SPFH domain-containing protein [Oscillospiraceae bacterium]
MAWFGQGKDTIEWEEFRDDLLFYKWPANEIKKGAKLIIRQGQKAVFFAGGAVEGVFETPGSYDITTEITPFLSTLKGWVSLRGDTGMRAEVYFVNAKELLLPWGTRQRIMIPSPEVPSGVPVGCNGNLIIEFRDYKTFISKIAGVKSDFALSDISERIMGELSPIIAECILGSQQSVGLNALIGLQANSRSLGKQLAAELDKELMEFGLGVRDLNILSINYPKEVQDMADKVAAQSFVGNVGKYAAVSMADSFGKEGGSGIGEMGAQVAMGAQLAQQMMGAITPQPAATAPASGDRFCPKCRKMVASKFCPDCGTETV